MNFKIWFENINSALELMKNIDSDDIKGNIDSIEVLGDILEDNGYPFIEKFRKVVLHFKENQHLYKGHPGLYAGVAWQIQNDVYNAMITAASWLESKV